MWGRHCREEGRDTRLSCDGGCGPCGQDAAVLGCPSRRIALRHGARCLRYPPSPAFRLFSSLTKTRAAPTHPQTFVPFGFGTSIL